MVGAAFFTLLPIYAPFVVLQTEEMPRFLLGLVAGVVAGAALALINGPARGILLVLACAFVGACIYVYVYAVRTFGPLGGGWPPTIFSFALAYLVLPAAVGVGLVLLARALLGRRG